MQPSESPPVKGMACLASLWHLAVAARRCQSCVTTDYGLSQWSQRSECCYLSHCLHAMSRCQRRKQMFDVALLVTTWAVKFASRAGHRVDCPLNENLLACRLHKRQVLTATDPSSGPQHFSFHGPGTERIYWFWPSRLRFTYSVGRTNRADLRWVFFATVMRRAGLELPVDTKTCHHVGKMWQQF